MRKKNSLIFILLCCLTACSSLKNVSYETITEKQSQEQLVNNLIVLSSDSLGGRNPKSDHFNLTLSYIENQLSKSKVKPFFGHSFRDTFLINETISYNLVGAIKSKKSTDSCILICAHYDHLGKRKYGKDRIYNGANDNASGVSAVIAMAQFLSKYKFKTNVIIALLSGEESGLIGSKHLAERLKKQQIKLKYVLNFEMLGKTLTGAENKVYITGYKKSNLSNVVNKQMGRDFIVFLPAEYKQRLFYRSDNYPFYQQFHIPSHTISTFDFKNDPFYHHTDDEFEHLDLKNYVKLVNESTWMVFNLLKNDPQLRLNN